MAAVCSSISLFMTALIINIHLIILYYRLTSLYNIVYALSNLDMPLFIKVWIENEAEFIQTLLSAGKKQLASQFNFTYRYIDDVLSINNPEFDK